MMQVELRAVSSLEKVFLDEAPAVRPLRVRGLRGEELSWQLSWTKLDGGRPAYVHAEVDSPIGAHVRLRMVKHVPCGLPVYDGTDDKYLRKTPGLFPDLLTDIGPWELRAYPHRWDTLWITVTTGDLAAGSYPVTIRLKDDEGETVAEHTQTVEVMPAALPEQTLIHTKWFHADCLATYYGVEVFSEEHWRIVENFVREAVRGGVNMLLTPIHTPPLDTRVGTERPTTQLVDVEVVNGQYRFNLDKLRRWIDMATRCGIRYFEMAHLFTQWGVKHAPKIMATVDGEYKRIFGWETDAAGEAYGTFLRAYIPVLRGFFREMGIEDRVWWHISDEPGKDHLTAYHAARAQVNEVLKGANMIDAISDIDYWRDGLISTPVVASDCLKPFFDENVQGMWTYYCCGQHIDLANLFIAMPSPRNRILGMQLYRYGFTGFLHWGFNFYNAQFSDYPIDPYRVTDGDGFAPAGDAFQVYPGKGGVPECSIRHEVSRECFQDLRALQLLDALGGREEAMDIVSGITMTEFPCDSEAYLALRERVNDAILQRLQ